MSFMAYQEGNVYFQCSTTKLHEHFFDFNVLATIALFSGEHKEIDHLYVTSGK
jgi:hypothetical protein